MITKSKTGLPAEMSSIESDLRQTGYSLASNVVSAKDLRPKQYLKRSAQTGNPGKFEGPPSVTLEWNE